MNSLISHQKNFIKFFLDVEFTLSLLKINRKSKLHNITFKSEI